MEDEFLKVAKQAAIEAGRILKKHFGKQHKYFLKKDPSDFATQADLESEQVIIKTITKNFPSHNIIAEERGTDNKESEYTWVIDPLDGTVTFAAGLEDANMGIDFGHRGTRSRKASTFIMPLMNKVRYLYELGSDAVMLAFVAKGGLDGFATDAWVWDFTGAAVIIEEAGGRITDPKGKEIDWTKDRIAVVASNGLIHDEILEALSK